MPQFKKKIFKNNTRKKQFYLLECVCVCVSMLNYVWLFATPWTVAYQAPLFMKFSRQE